MWNLVDTIAESSSAVFIGTPSWRKPRLGRSLPPTKPPTAGRLVQSASGPVPSIRRREPSAEETRPSARRSSTVAILGFGGKPDHDRRHLRVRSLSLARRIAVGTHLGSSRRRSIVARAELPQFG